VSTLIDEARIFVQAGKGGNGSASFRREKFVPRGGPDGGDGGRGGSVFLRAVPSIGTLMDLQHRRHIRATPGGNGAHRRQHGRKGSDVVVDVPLGTVITDETDSSLVADLRFPFEEVMVARGGRGGLGNTHFATPSNRAPRVAQKGEPGEERWVKLELKTLADVGIVGEPNAGKSSLLAAVSAAEPKIGAYPFTTLSPNLGVVDVDERPIVLADIPGLIEGAHEGAGLGLVFLRHVERARVLLHVVDGSADPILSFDRVRAEMSLYKDELLEKPVLVAVNKLDIPEAAQAWDTVRGEFEQRGLSVVGVSAQTRDGIDTMLARLSEMVAAVPDERPMAADTMKVYRFAPEEERWTVVKEADGARVVGRRIERIASMTDMENPEAVEHFERQLSRMGIIQALERAGVGPGDTVRIGNQEMEWT
jgi:GTP-binding protein